MTDHRRAIVTGARRVTTAWPDTCEHHGVMRKCCNSPVGWDHQSRCLAFGTSKPTLIVVDEAELHFGWYGPLACSGGCDLSQATGYHLVVPADIPPFIYACPSAGVELFIADALDGAANVA